MVEVSRRKEIAQAHAVGLFLKAQDDADSAQKPLKFSRTTVGRRREDWKKGEGREFRYVWRDPEGRFAKRPAQGERAKALKLPHAGK